MAIKNTEFRIRKGGVVYVLHFQSNTHIIQVIADAGASNPTGSLSKLLYDTMIDTTTDKNSATQLTATSNEKAMGQIIKFHKVAKTGLYSDLKDTPTLATQAEAEAGTDNAKLMTPLQTKNAILKLSPAEPDASSTVKGVVKITDDYSGSAQDTAASQKAARALYDALMVHINNLMSPIDYIGYMEADWRGGVTTQEQINLAILAQFPELNNNPHGGHAVMVKNIAPDMFGYQNTYGFWLWIFDGNNFIPTIDFPEVEIASYAGSTESAMVEGLITKAMLWKLKNIADNAQVNVIEKIKVNGVEQSIQGTDKYVNVSVPTKTSDIVNDTDFQDGTQVTQEITDKIGLVIPTLQTKIKMVDSTATEVEKTPTNDGDMVMILA